MDTKGLRLEVKDADRGEVRAVFSTFNAVDKDGDVTRPGAFEDGAPVRISAYGHASWAGALPVGKGVIRATRTEAILEGQFFMDTQAGHDTFTVVKELAELQEWSYGFDVVKHSYGDFEGRKVRFLEQVRTYEVSPVLLGAGMNTRTLAAKSAPGRLDDQTRAWLASLFLKVTHERLERDLQIEKEREYGRAALAEAAKRVMVWYVEVDETGVPASSKATAHAAIADYCIELRHGPMPALRWFRPEARAEADYLELYGRPATLGFGWPYPIAAKADRASNEVWIRADLPADEIHVSAAHEVAHLAGADETAAQAFEVKARADYRRRVTQ